MKILTLFLLFFSTSLIASQEQKNGVYQLTSSNFEQFIKSHDHVLVKFYASWCQHSQKLQPEFEKAAAALSPSKIILAEVDCDTETNLAQGLMIDNYPTMLYFLKQKLIEYNGGKTKQEIEQWLLPPVTLVRSTEQLEEYSKNKNNVIVLYFGEQSGEEYQEYEETVHLFNNNNLIFLSSPSLMNKFNIPDIPYIILLKSFEQNRVDFTGKINSIELKIFITLNMYPRIVQLSEETADYVFSDNNPVIFLYLNNMANLTELEKNSVKEFHSSAEDIKRELLMMSECYQDSEVCVRIAEFTGITLIKTPLLQILDPRGPVIKKYILSGEITRESIKEFVNSFESGLLKPYYKSQEIPLEDTKNQIKTVVGKNFIDEVIKRKENIVVNFYADWCTKSQQFKPVYEKLSEMMTDQSRLLFYQIEASENEIPDIEIDFFPTIMLFTSANKQNPILFKGERQLDILIEFINSNLEEQDQKSEEIKQKTDL